MPDPAYSWALFVVACFAVAAREGYRRGLADGVARERRRLLASSRRVVAARYGDEGLDKFAESMVEAIAPGGGRPVIAAAPPRPAVKQTPLRDGMTVDEAADATGVTVEEFVRRIR